ncbi:MAG: hypothetical protein ACRDUV_10840 [Pseudonocardiaceae bacterium]
MPTTPPVQRGIDPAASTTPMPTVDAPLQLSTKTLDWLAGHPHARRLVRSVWDQLAELERGGQHPGPIDALRSILTHHQPTSRGRCHTCRCWRWCRRPFPCAVWHQIRGELLGQFAGGGRHGESTIGT